MAVGPAVEPAAAAVDATATDPAAAAVDPTPIELAPAEPGTAEPSPAAPGPDVENAAMNVVDAAEALFLERQREGELQSEKKAKEQVVEWLKNKTSLEHAIDEALKDHLEIHEKAHSVRLMFEAEKAALLAKVRESSRSSSFKPADPDDFYLDLAHDGDSSRKRRERSSPTDALELEGPLEATGGTDDGKAPTPAGKACKKFVTPTKA